MIVWLIIIFYIFLILNQIHNSLTLKENYECLDEINKPYNELCIKNENLPSQNICISDTLNKLCNLDTKLKKIINDNKPDSPPSTS